ncbi:MAG: tetratricopeptide repeat protein [Prevotella sp.]|jgi:tetratricopeptide (TPR) repeat protein|nr:tetratricopeptide repeat protein [Prevotella sp.]
MDKYNKKILSLVMLLQIISLNLSAKFWKTPSTIHDITLVKEYLDRSRKFDTPDKKSIDSSLYYIDKANILLEGVKDDNLLYHIHKEYVKFFTNTWNYSMALEHSFKLKQLLENSPDKWNATIRDKYITLYTSIGIIYFNLNNQEKTLDNLYQAEKLALEDFLEDRKEGFKLSVVYNNIGSVYLQKKELDEAKKYYEKSLLYSRYSNDGNKIKEYNSALHNNLGIIFMEKGDYNVALDYYNKSLQIRKIVNDKDGLAQVYNNMGSCYFRLKNYNKALGFLEKSIGLCKETRNFKSEMIAVRIMSVIYSIKKDYKNEAIMHMTESALKDSIASQENMRQVIQLETRYEYEKKRKRYELEQQIALAEEEKNTLLFIMITGVLFLSVLVLILLYCNLKIKNKRDKLQSDSFALQQKNLELEKQNLILHNSTLEQEVESKVKELTTHMMYLVQKNEFIDFVTGKLGELTEVKSKPINKQSINSLIKQMKANVDKTSWDDFEIRFQQIHQDFHTKLHEKYPNLTPNERRLCAFLYLNMTTKEISSITFQSIKSIEVARTRLRRKLQIDKGNLIIALHNL